MDAHVFVVQRGTEEARWTGGQPADREEQFLKSCSAWFGDSNEEPAHLVHYETAFFIR